MPKFSTIVASREPIRYDGGEFLGTVTCPYLEGGREMDWDIYMVPSVFGRYLIAHYGPSESDYDQATRDRESSRLEALLAKASPAEAKGIRTELAKLVVQHRRLIYPAWMPGEGYTVPLPILLGSRLVPEKDHLLLLKRR